MNSVNQVQILDEAVCILKRVYTLWNQTFSSTSSYLQIVGQIELFNVGIVTDLREGNYLHCALKLTLCLTCSIREGWDKYIQTVYSIITHHILLCYKTETQGRMARERVKGIIAPR